MTEFHQLLSNDFIGEKAPNLGQETLKTEITVIYGQMITFLDLKRKTKKKKFQFELLGVPH